MVSFGPELKSVKGHPWLSGHAEWLLVVAHVVVRRLMFSFRSSVSSPLPTTLSPQRLPPSGLPSFFLRFTLSLTLSVAGKVLIDSLVHLSGEIWGLFPVELVERLNQKILRAELSSKPSSRRNSDKRSETSADKTSELRARRISAEVVHVRAFEEAQGRIVFATSALELLRPFLAPSYAFAVSGPRDSVKPVPAYVAFFLRFLAGAVERERHSQCAATLVQDERAPRVDAQASDERAGVGGWLPAEGQTVSIRWYGTAYVRGSEYCILAWL